MGRDGRGLRCRAGYQPTETMKTRSTKLMLATAAAILFGALSQGVQAAHESNNRALLEGDDAAIQGHAIVNYVKGKESWTASVLVQDLPAGSYWFAVRFNSGGTIGEPQPICMLEVGDEGMAACADSMFDLGGFHEALILDAEGNIVASGFFERRGGNRVSD